MKTLIKFLLLGIFILLSIFSDLKYIKDSVGLLSLYDQHSTSQLSHQVIDRSGSKIIVGTVTPTTQNLSGLYIPLSRVNQIGEKHLQFRIKQEGENSWIFKTTRDIKESEDISNYPIGFPTITNSKNKTYYFEVEQNISSDSGQLIFKKDTFFLTMYQFRTGELRNNHELMLSFISRKVQNIFNNHDFKITVLINIFPIIFLLSFYRSNKKPLLAIIFILVALCVDTLLLPDKFSILYFLIVAQLIFSILYFHLEANFSTSLSLISLTSIVVLLFWYPIHNPIFDKIITWTYTFIIINLIQRILELVIRPSKQIILAVFLKEHGISVKKILGPTYNQIKHSSLYISTIKYLHKSFGRFPIYKKVTKFNFQNALIGGLIIILSLLIFIGNSMLNSFINSDNNYPAKIHNRVQHALSPFRLVNISSAKISKQQNAISVELSLQKHFIISEVNIMFYQESKKDINIYFMPDDTWVKVGSIKSNKSTNLKILIDQNKRVKTDSVKLEFLNFGTGDILELPQDIRLNRSLRGSLVDWVSCQLLKNNVLPTKTRC